MTDERNAARAEAERLAAVVKDMGYSDKARDHFVEKGMDAKDAKWAADIALPTMKASEVEVADIGTFLDEKFAKLYPTGAGSDGQPPPDSDNVPTPDASQPPDFARPSPASEGTPPGQEMLTINSPEIKALIEANDRAGIEKLDKAGRIAWRAATPVHPG